MSAALFDEIKLGSLSSSSLDVSSSFVHFFCGVSILQWLLKISALLFRYIHSEDFEPISQFVITKQNLSGRITCVYVASVARPVCLPLAWDVSKC